MTISAEVIEMVRAACNITELVGEHIQLRRSGIELCGRCPFHADKTPSLFVRPGKGVFYCHGCGVGGDALEFVRLIHHCSFRQSVAILATRAGIKVEGFKPSPELTEKVAALKSQREEQMQFERFCNDRIEAVNRRHRALGRSATWAEECLRAGETDVVVHEMAWAAIRRYIDFQNRIEREGLCDPEVLKAEWEQQHVAA